MSEAAAQRSGRLPRSEGILAALILASSLGLRILYSLRQSFDTDEPQHLHVAWAWGRGLVAYRDFFDNHAPLFHILAAPLVAAGGERPELLIWARYGMLPLVAVLLGCLYRLASALFSPRVGLWAASLTSVLPSFLYDSVEFRADVLWATLWIGGLVVWAEGALTPARGLVLGVVLGLAMAASVKTIFLALSFGAAWLAVITLDATLEKKPGHWPSLRALAALASGFAIVIVVALGAFHTAGMLRAAFACLVAHNFSSVVLWQDRWLRVAMFAVTLPLLVLAAGLASRHSAMEVEPRATLLLSTGLYYTTLNGFLPIVPTQNFLPFYPLLVLLLSGFGLEALERRAHPRIGAATVLAAIAIGEIALLLYASPLSIDRTRFERGLVADVLRLTRPDEPVLDLKGESIFRPRPVYAVLEHITEEHLRSGRMTDDIAEHMVASRTYVTVMDSPRFPPKARSFLLENYLPVGRVRVAGKLLAADRDGTMRFEVHVPGRYAVLSPDGPAAGVLDGAALEGSRLLDSGRHWFHPAEARAPLALLWANAAEKSFSPFHPGEPPP